MAQGAHTHHIPGTELTTGMCSGRYPTEKGSFLLPDPSKAVQEAHLRSETREGTHLSVEAIQSEAEISTSYQFSLDPQLLRLLSRSCCFQGPAAHHMCTASFSAYIENQLHFHPQNADELCILCWTKSLQLSTSIEALVLFKQPQIPSLWHNL